jgi:hypothetical protein
MASTTRSSNGRSKQAATRSSAAPSRSATADRAARSRSRAGRANGGSSGSPSSRASRSSDRSEGRIGAMTRTIGSAAKKAKTPLVASGAAAAGLATGTALGAHVRASRRPRVLGMPMPRTDEMKSGAQKAARAGRWLYDFETDLRLLREHAESSRRQSPIEVLLSGLTSRTLPRRG